MAHERLDLDLCAQVLVTAMLKGDEAAAKQFKLSTKTVSRYRAAMRESPELSRLVREKKTTVEAEWQSELRDSIREGILFLKRAAMTADAADPDAIHAIAGAIKIMSETDMTSKVIDARLAAQDRSSREEYGEVAPALTEETPQVTH